MAINRIYSVFDRKSLIWSPPISQPTDGAAIRSLREAVSALDHPIGKHPSDYVLFFIGTFDDAKGALAAESPLVHVIDAIALVEERHQPSLPFGLVNGPGANGSGMPASSFPKPGEEV